jgi:hypothetical protein
MQVKMSLLKTGFKWREALVHAMGMVLLLSLIGLVTLTDVLAWL